MQRIKVSPSEPATVCDLILEGVAYIDVGNEREVGLEALGGSTLGLFRLPIKKNNATQRKITKTDRKVLILSLTRNDSALLVAPMSK